MIKTISFRTLVWLAAVFGFTAPIASAFPENIRHGYTNCSSCHVSPSGGGVLTQYGRQTSEDILATWSRKDESGFLHGAVQLPEALNIGGDIRFLSLQKDNKITESSVGFPMQADFEVAYRVFDTLTLDAAVGSYDGTPGSRRHFVLWQPTENWYVRGGRFFPAFGIFNPDHSIATRKFLRFDQNMETYNAEVGYLSENFEVIVNAITGAMGEKVERDDGFSGRFAYYLGKDNQIGTSLLRGEGAVWTRDVWGVFGLFTFAKQGLFQTEIDWQSRKAVDSGDSSLPDNAAVVSFSRLSWEFTRGLDTFVSYEALDSTKGDFTRKQRSYGPGVQWIPRPHFEFLAKYEMKLDEVYSKDYGTQAMLMSHYYF